MTSLQGAAFALPDPVVLVAPATPLLAGAPRWAPGSPPGVWPARAFPVPFALGLVPSRPGTPSREDLADELDVALRTWSLPACSGYRARFAGDAPPGAGEGGDDGTSTVVVHGDAWPAELEPDAVAQTVVRLNGSGEVREADVHLNAVQYRFSLDGAPGTVDLRSVLVHELGHALGLGHSRDARATMAPSGSGLRWRSLEADDVAGVCALYPGAGDGGCDATACPTSHVCVARVCQRRGARGAVCAPCDPRAATPPCEAAGDGARCVDPALLDPRDAPPAATDPRGSVCGRPCTTDVECGKDFACRRTTPAGDTQCVARDACLGAQVPCTTDADCPGATCRAGACVGPTTSAPDAAAPGEDAGVALAGGADVRAGGGACASSARTTRAWPVAAVVGLALLLRLRRRA